MLSPVWTPIGSMFSIEQMTTKLSATSRITSSSNSFQPMTDSSIEDLVDRAELEPALGDLAELLDVVGDAAADAAQRERRPDDERETRACSTSVQGFVERSCDDRSAGTSRPISRIASLNSSRSSATLIASIDAPISLTLYFSRTPRSASSTARLSAVWPPTVGSIASGRSRAMIASTTSGGERLDVGAVGQLGVGHDRRRVAVDQDDLEPFGTQRLAGLRCRSSRTRTPGR